MKLTGPLLVLFLACAGGMGCSNAEPKKAELSAEQKAQNAKAHDEMKAKMAPPGGASTPEAPK